MTVFEKRCEDCVCLINKNGKMCCDELWGRPCNDIGADECPEEITIEESQELVEKTKNMRVDVGKTGNKHKKSEKPRTVKVSDAKKQLFSEIWNDISSIYGKNAEIVKENKLILVKMGEKTFKIDLIEQRPPKK